MPQQSQILPPSAGVGNTSGAKIDWSSFAAVIVLSCHLCRAGRACSAPNIWLTRQYLADWLHSHWSLYLGIVFVCRGLHILVPVGLKLCDIVFEGDDGCYVEPCHLPLHWQEINSCRKGLSSKTLGPCWKELRDPLLWQHSFISLYWQAWPLLASCIRLSRPPRAWYRSSSLELDSACPSWDIPVVQRLDPDVPASDDGLSYSALHKTDD